MKPKLFIRGGTSLCWLQFASDETEEYEDATSDSFERVDFDEEYDDGLHDVRWRLTGEGWHQRPLQPELQVDEALSG